MGLGNATLKGRFWRFGSRAVRLLLAAIWTLCASVAFAQEPPETVPAAVLSGKPPPTAIVAGDWLLYPTVRTFTAYADNWFMSPSSPISALGFGIAPALTAEWSNGIHTTTLYGNAERRVFPTENEINAFDYQAGITQRYEMMRDLIFRFQVDDTHKTVSAGAFGSIPGPVASPATTTLPNGNTQLPNGNIVTPTGQSAGQANPGLTVNGQSVVNPYDTFTGTVSVDKYLNRGIISLSTSFADQYFLKDPTQNFSTRTFSGNGAFWLTPVLYAFSNGVLSQGITSTNDTASFRSVAGIGFRANPLFGASAYYGGQGSESSPSGGGATTLAGGEVFGAKASYNPTPDLTFTAGIDVTVNKPEQSGQAAAAVSSPFVLSLPTPTPLLLPLNQSTRTSQWLFSADYTISQQWKFLGTFGYTNVDYPGSPRLDNVWLVDAVLTYEMWRNLTLNWEYQFSSIDSNAPGVSAKRNYVTMGAFYKF